MSRMNEVKSALVLDRMAEHTWNAKSSGPLFPFCQMIAYAN